MFQLIILGCVIVAAVCLYRNPTFYTVYFVCIAMMAGMFWLVAVGAGWITEPGWGNYFGWFVFALIADSLSNVTLSNRSVMTQLKRLQNEAREEQ